jgi:hypothetical protein
LSNFTSFKFSSFVTKHGTIDYNNVENVKDLKYLNEVKFLDIRLMGYFQIHMMPEAMLDFF